jgi:error-prone DNA polymerase
MANWSEGAGFVPLWCRSNFSFLQGASHPEELVEEAHRLGLGSLALTDRDGVHGVVRAHLAARRLGMHLICGAEITVGAHPRLVLLAQDATGWASLCRLLSTGRLRSPKGQSRVTWEEVGEAAPGLVALVGGNEVVQADGVDPPLGLLREAFGERVFVGLSRHRTPRDEAMTAAAGAVERRWGILPVALPEVLYHHPGRRALQDVMTCIRQGVPIHRIGNRTRPNAEHALMSPLEAQARWADRPDALARTVAIARSCTFALDSLRYRYPSETWEPGDTAQARLRRLVAEGAARRYPRGVPPEVEAQLGRELEVIEALEYGGYFLTMHDLVAWCRTREILCQGRGSAANSAVCYCLGITAIDPVRMGLLFERFLSRERAEPPDIDLDIAHQRREEVIQYVYARYGREHAAMVATVIRYRPRSAVRDVGRALGIPSARLDRVARLLSHHRSVDTTVLQEAGLDPEAPLHRHLLHLSNELLDMPRHLSIHPGGFLLGHAPLHTLVPVENATMADRTVIQWDKDDVEALGLFKVDLLGLGALTHIDLCLRMIAAHGGPTLQLADLPADDDATFEMIRQAQTVGVFQIESRAQMQMLPRLQPRTFYDLVIEISIVRPGPITGDMVHPYLRRRRGEEPVTWPHPSLRPVLEKTLGVPLFQEQVMKLAIVAADYTPGEADQLRRDMGAWRSSGRIEEHRQRITGRMIARGIDPEFAERVFAQIRGFGEYGFPESHAASFALISWATAWLRCHHPAAFTATLLNAQPMGFYSSATVIEDARRRGVEVRPPDIECSHWGCTLEPASGAGQADRWAVRLGLRPVRGLREADMVRLVAARAAHPFGSVDDLRQRAALGRPALEALARAGALASLEGDRRSALWLAGLRHGPAEDPWTHVPAETPELDPLHQADRLLWDQQALGCSAEGHLLLAWRGALQAEGLMDAEGVQRARDGSRIRTAGLVICRQRPGTASGVVFLSLEDETGVVNVVLWPGVFEAHEVLVKTTPLLAVEGQVQSRDGVVNLIAERLWAPSLTLSEVRIRSHDFH